MKKILLLLALLSTAASSAFAGAGYYDPFVIINGSFFDLGATTANPDFQGSLLGVFDPSSQQLLLGGQQRTFKNGTSDVTGTSLQFSIYIGVPTGSFSTINYVFQWNAGDSGAPPELQNAGDQQWGTNVEGANGTDGAVDILAGLLPGIYTLEVYSQTTTNGQDGADPTIFNNNGGANYTATFTVVPEPSSLALIAGPTLLGAWFFVRRRRA